VSELLREGVELNATDRAGNTPLMYALENPAASVELVQLLPRSPRRRRRNQPR